MRFFLDVGANTGQTLRAVLDPKYRFDRIVCFEPVRKCCTALLSFRDPRITVANFGLWKQTCDKPIYDPGSLGGSMFCGLEGANTSVKEICQFVRASDWFKANICKDDVVFLKLNCEGSECDIIEDLLNSGEYGKVTFMMVDFDVRKIPEQRHRETEIKKRLTEPGFTNYAFCEDVMIGPTHVSRIQNWLHSVGADQCSLATQLRQLWYVLRAPSEVRDSIVSNAWRRWLRRLMARKIYLALRSAWHR